MNGIGIAGVGTVACGVGRASVARRLERGAPIHPTLVPRAGGGGALPVREVPPLVPSPAWTKHPRLRRASPITLYAVSAVAGVHHGRRVGGALDATGLILCLLAGCVQYTERFFGEVLADPSSASPLLFPKPSSTRRRVMSQRCWAHRL
jgi:hypothetical protein